MSPLLFRTALLFLMSTILFSAGVYGQNFVPNPDFRNGLSGWTIAGFATGSPNSSEGLPAPPSAELSQGAFNEAPASSLRSSCMAVDSTTKTYQASANVKVPVGRFTFVLLVFDSASCAGVGQIAYQLDIQQNAQWQSVTIPDIELDPSFAAVQIGFFVAGGSQDTDGFIDHVFLGEQQTTPVRLQFFGVD